MALVAFIHLLGSALWIGGAMAAMTMALGARGEPPAVQAGVYRVLAHVHTLVIGLGAALAAASGVLLTMALATAGGNDLVRNPRVWVMQGAGLVGAALVLFVGLPTAVRLGALAVADTSGRLPPAFDVYRRRQAVVSSVAGTLAVVALLAWKVL